MWSALDIQLCFLYIAISQSEFLFLEMSEPFSPENSTAKDTLADKDILHLPPGQLAELSFRRLRESKTLERAAKSALYRSKWEAVNIKPREIVTYKEFSQIPFITGREIREAFDKNPVEDVVCSDAIVHWFSTTGTTGTSKWIPVSQRDVELFMEIRDRCYKLTPSTEGLKCWAISGPAPFAENGLAGFERVHAMMTHVKREGVDISFTEVDREDSVNFALDMKPSFIASSPSLAARFAELFTERAPEVARERWRKQKSLRNLAAYWVTRFKKIHPKHLSKFDWGLFGGEPLEPYRQILRREFGLEPYEIYMFTEFFCPFVECRMHDGMHLWMDICLAEVISELELDKENRDTAYTPQAIPLWQAEQGSRGELVLTTFGEGLPLVRYRSGDLIEVVSVEPCQCGVTHPRIRVPRRSDHILCLGMIRFPVEQLEEKLLAETAHGQAKRWQLRITREDYRSKIIIQLEPSGEINDKEGFRREILKKLKELKILGTGIENRVVLEPVVLLEERISEEGRLVTKAGRVIYEEKVP